MPTPSRYSEAAFRRFEPFIRDIVSTFPTPVTLNPYPLSPETFTHRLRDALNGHIKFRYPTDIPDSDLYKVFHFLGQSGTFHLSHDGGTVFIGPRQRVLHVPIGTFRPANTTITPKAGQLDARNEDIFRAIALLKHHEIIKQPVNFVNVSNEQVKEIEDSYGNCEIFQDENSFILL